MVGRQLVQNPKMRAQSASLSILFNFDGSFLPFVSKGLSFVLIFTTLTLVCTNVHNSMLQGDERQGTNIAPNLKIYTSA